MTDRDPPLARDLSAVEPSYTWRYGDPGRPAGTHPGGVPIGEDEGEEAGAEMTEAERLTARVAALTAALEDVVALALSGADYKERAIMMHRRAIAALSGLPVARPGEPPSRHAG